MVASEKSRYISFGTCLLGAIATVAVAAWYLRAPIPTINAAKAEELRAAADQLGEHNGSVDEAFWPIVIQNLSPKSVEVTNDGVYVVLRSFFVEEEGVFILSARSSLQTSQGSDPSYRQLHERVYRYEIKG